MPEGDNAFRGTLTKDGFYLWVFRRIASKLGSGDAKDSSEVVRWLLQRVTEIDADYMARRFGVSQEAFDQERGLAKVLPIAREGAKADKRPADTKAGDKPAAT
jgi:hypothetical protein